MRGKRCFYRPTYDSQRLTQDHRVGLCAPSWQGWVRRRKKKLVKCGRRENAAQAESLVCLSSIIIQNFENARCIYRIYVLRSICLISRSTRLHACRPRCGGVSGCLCRVSECAIVWKWGCATGWGPAQVSVEKENYYERRIPTAWVASCACCMLASASMHASVHPSTLWHACSSLCWCNACLWRLDMRNRDVI